MNTPFNPTHWYKPLDFGNGLLSGSVAASGHWLSVNTYHPQFGFITLTDLEPFSEALRTDRTAVRAYRANMAAGSRLGFGLTFIGEWVQRAYMLEEAIPQVILENDSASIELTTFAPRDACVALQHCRIVNKSQSDLNLTYRWHGSLSLQRAANLQLPDYGAQPTAASLTHFVFDGSLLHLHNPALSSAAYIKGLPTGTVWTRQSEKPLEVSFDAELTLAPGESREFSVSIELQAPNGKPPSENQADLIQREHQFWSQLWAQIKAPPSKLPLWQQRRALAYFLAACAIPSHDGFCLVSDHQLVPLSSNRESYYLARSLLSVGAEIEIVRRIVRGHLKWLIRHAERPQGFWGLSYWPNGRVKDPAFYLDQQCYPLLELCDYVRETGDTSIVIENALWLSSQLDLLLSRRTGTVYLFASDKQAATDPLMLPYHFSSHVLLWHTLMELAQLNQRVHFTWLALGEIAARVQTETLQHFTIKHQASELFAYAIDLHGEKRLYHDAINLPTALAPLWGFCSADDARWRNTMTWAFSDQNVGGYYAGRFGGLGLIYTGHPSPLGDAQEWLYHQVIGNVEQAERIAQKLSAIAAWDGLWPEAYHEQNGAIAARHWIAWPAATWLWFQFLPPAKPPPIAAVSAEPLTNLEVLTPA